MKQDRNPFKMWGSWIGVTIGLLVIGLLHGVSAPASNFGIRMLQFFSEIVDNLNRGFSTEPVSVVIYMAIGFLVGWGVTVLFRKKRGVY